MSANATADIDRTDPQWYTAAALAGITLAAATGSFAVDPGLITGGIAGGLAVVFLGLIDGLAPEGDHA